MPANFLIVCGGAGRGILQHFDALGFAGALQIDVQRELVQTRDGRILQVGLPVGYGAHTFDGPAIMADYLQRLEAQWHAHHTQAAHTGDMQACHMDECPDYHHQRNHARVVMNAQPPAQLRAGTHAPLMMRAYVTQPRVTHTIAQALVQLRNWIPATEQNVTVWLVASTCGVTGNGIVHHVADLVLQEFANLSVRIKFIRIGAVSYRSVVPNADIATFWAVLTGNGYRRGIADGQTVAFNYIDVDVPDVGRDVQAREKLVSETVLALVQPHIDRQFAQMVAGSDMVMARVGTWGHEFDHNAVYKLTLIQLNQKLEELLQPSEAAVLAHIQSVAVNDLIELMSPEFSTLYETVAQSTAMQPVLAGLTHIDTRLYAVNSLESLRSHLWSKMQQLVMHIFDEETQKTLRRQVQMSITVNYKTEQLNFGGEGNDADYYIGSEEHIKLIRLAQYAKVQAKHFLLGDRDSPGYVMTELREAWDGLIPIGPVGLSVEFKGLRRLFVTDEQRRVAFLDGIPRFLQAYFRVARWLEIAGEADAVIWQAYVNFSSLIRALDDRQIQQFDVVITVEYTQCAELDETFGGDQTWLQMLRRSLVGDIEQVVRSGKFRRIVEMGAIGLTEDGLKYVMEMPAYAHVEQIVDQLNTNVGSNNSVWWQGIQQPRNSGRYGNRTNLWGVHPLNTFNYRIFPKLPSGVRTSLRTANTNWGLKNAQPSPEYMVLNSSALGLKVYAVQCAVPDSVEALQILALIKPMLDALNSRHPQYAMGSGKFDLNNYISTQCTHSIGLPIRVPSALMNDPAIKDIMTIMADYLVIDQS